MLENEEKHVESGQTNVRISLPSELLRCGSHKLKAAVLEKINQEILALDYSGETVTSETSIEINAKTFFRLANAWSIAIDIYVENATSAHPSHFFISLNTVNEKIFTKILEKESGNFIPFVFNDSKVYVARNADYDPDILEYVRYRSEDDSSVKIDDLPLRFKLMP